MGKLTRITWPQRYSELQRMEELLLCGICYDYMDTSVMTPCSHNYCSLCIRKYLHYKTQCPACFEKTFEKDLHTNRIVDELISYFGKIRLKLVDSISGAKVETPEDGDVVSGSPQTTPVRPARSNQSQKKSSSKLETKRNKISASDSSEKVERTSSIVATPVKNLSVPSTSGVSKSATMFDARSEKNRSTDVTLPCPVCRVEICEVNMNKHLDDCLKRETASQQPLRTKTKRKPLPKLVFSLMKDTELRKKIKELGLPTQGDRKTLESRFQRYSILYNAECDKTEPRPVEELIRQCDEEEALEKKMLKTSQTGNRLKINRRAEQKIIEEAQQKYLESNKKSYENLIVSIKEREKSRKCSAMRNSNVQQNVEESIDESSKNVGREKNAKNIDDVDDESNLTSYSAVNAHDDVFFQDSDSEVYCPLQRYASDDPKKFLTVEVSTSGRSRNENSDEIGTNSSPSRSNDDDSSDVKRFSVSTRNFNTGNDETNDVPATAPRPKPAARHSTKRAKLSLMRAATVDDAEKLKNDEKKLEGEKLAREIARDFTFDTSSNDSVDDKATRDA